MRQGRDWTQVRLESQQRQRGSSHERQRIEDEELTIGKLAINSGSVLVFQLPTTPYAV